MSNDIGVKFDRGKPFYPYIMVYIASIHGLVELMSRGSYKLVKQAKANGTSLERFIQGVYDERLKSFIEEIYVRDLEPTRLMGMNLSMKSEITNGHILFSPEELSQDLISNHEYLLPFYARSASSLMLVAYESTKENFDKRDVLWNFFFHCRNAAAHNGKFKFTNVKNPERERFPAKWRTLEITKEMEGSNLFNDGTGGLLSLGDPLYLLHDIELKYIT